MVNIISKAPRELPVVLGKAGGGPVSRVEVQLQVTGGK